MSDALATLNNLGIELRTGDDVEIKGGGEYLPRFQLCTSSSNACKDGVVNPNNFALVEGSDFESLGREVDVLLIDLHMKALDMSGESVVDAYDVKSDIYQDIASRSLVKDSQCMEGPEFLIWIPKANKYATMFFGSKSSKREGKIVAKKMRSVVTFYAKKIEGKKHTWYIASPRECHTPPSQQPDPQELKSAVEMFRDAEKPKSGGPVAEPATESGRAR